MMIGPEAPAGGRPLIWCQTVRSRVLQSLTRSTLSRVPGNVNGYPSRVTENTTERTAGGPLGRFAGKAKEAAGSVLGNEELAREGRLQQAQTDAEEVAQREAREAEQAAAEAGTQAQRDELALERERLEAELAEEQRLEQIERDAARERAEAARHEAAAEAERSAEQRAAGAEEERARQERAAAEAETARLEQQARAAEARADAIDPEER